MMELMPYLWAFLIGAAVASLFWTWRFKMPPSRLELLNHNIALNIVASEAMSRLDEDEQREVAEDVQEPLEDAFGEGSAMVEVDDVE